MCASKSTITVTSNGKPENVFSKIATYFSLCLLIAVLGTGLGCDSQLSEYEVAETHSALSDEHYATILDWQMKQARSSYETDQAIVRIDQYDRMKLTREKEQINQTNLLQKTVEANPYSQPQNAPLPCPVPSPVKLWVCVDLSYGREQPDHTAPIVWMMSQKDNWYFEISHIISFNKSREWVQLYHGTARAWVLDSDLCTTRPAVKTPPPSQIIGQCSQGCTTPPLGCNIKGNISFDTGEKIYHIPGQKYYNATVINPSYGERWFCTETEAIANGWRKSAE